MAKSLIFYEYNEIVCGEDTEDGHNKDFKEKLDKQFIFEIVILMVCPMPFFDMYISIPCNGITSDGKKESVVYLLSELIFVFMWIRMFFLMRSAFNYSIYTDPLARKLCKAYGCESSILFTFKTHV